MRFGTILADPPWKLSGGKNGKGGWSASVSPDAHYSLMDTADILRLPVQQLASEDSHLYLWIPNGMLPTGLQVMATWGFRYVNNRCWDKTTGYGIGQYFRTQHELCLFGIRGSPGYKRDERGKKCQVRSLFHAPRTKHSEKPPEFRKDIEHVSPGPYLEMFAREKVEGWSSWGNEVANDVELIQSTVEFVFKEIVKDDQFERMI